MIQIGRGILLGKTRPGKAIEDLLSKINYQVVAVGDPNFSLMHGVEYVPDLKGLRGKLRSLKEIASPSHTTLLIPKPLAESQEGKEFIAETERVKLGYSFVVFNPGDPRQKYEEIRALGRIRASIGPEFEKWMKELGLGRLVARPGYYEFWNFINSPVFGEVIAAFAGRIALKTAA